MKAYIKIILILLIPLGIIIGYALVEKDFGFRKIELDIDSILAKTEKSSQLTDSIEIRHTPQTITELTEPNSIKPDTIVLDTATQRILFIGDSMLEGLSRRLCDYVLANGHTQTSVIWYSSTSQYWAESDTLEYFIRKTTPTFIIVCLGSNELFVRDLSERDVWLNKLIKKIGNIPFVWVSPPNWREDTGINEIIIKNVGKQRYFDSRKLTLKRGRDKIHPTFKAAETWMDSIAVWIMEKSVHPIRLNIPKEKRKRDYKLYILTGNP